RAGRNPARRRGRRRGPTMIFNSLIPDSSILLAALGRVTLVAALAWIFWLATRRHGPALRAALLLAGVLAALAVPLLAGVTPVVVSVPALASASVTEHQPEALLTEDASIEYEPEPTLRSARVSDPADSSTEGLHELTPAAFVPANAHAGTFSL